MSKLVATLELKFENVVDEVVCPDKLLQPAPFAEQSAGGVQTCHWKVVPAGGLPLNPAVTVCGSAFPLELFFWIVSDGGVMS